MSDPKAPRAPKKPHVEHRHGLSVQDPYAWLKDPNWQQVLKEPERLLPDIRAYLDAENAYAKQAMAGTEALQAELFEELKGRIKEDDSSVPFPDGPWEYFHRFDAGQQYPRYYRRPRGGGIEKVLLDVPALAKDHGFFRIGVVRHAPDHARLAYSVDTKGSERFQLRVVDLASGTALPDQITDVSGNFVWGNDGRSLFYASLDEHVRAKWVRRHRLGQGTANDELLYEEKDDGFFLSLGVTASRRFVVLTAYDHTAAEAHVLEAGEASARFRLIEARRPNVLYHLSHHGDRFLITLHEAPEKDGRIVTTPISAQSRHEWRDLVPYRAGTLIEDTLTFAGHHARLELEGALPRIVVRDLATGTEHTVAFDEAAYHLTLVQGHEYATTTLRFTYSSMATPERTFDYDMATRTRKLLKEQEIPSGHDPSQYVVERFSAPARDGQMVPVTLLKHKTKTPPGAPLLLYGYGSYGRAMPAGFGPNRLSLVDRGFAFAIAHVRGGKDKGFAWYESAKLLNKKRTFEDFIDCGEELIRRGVTAKGRIVGHGASAGGMLMGAVFNMAPELFWGMVADVPFVDVLNTMWDKNLPLTPPEWPEWGNPIQSREAHEYIGSYSPYDNVADAAGAARYPNLLVLAGLTDPRVTYWEPAKWVAKLREVYPEGRRLLLDVNMGAGHAGASGRFDVLRKVALIYAFALGCR